MIDCEFFQASRFQGKYAVIGGAVPWLLLDNHEMPHVGTLDVDLGLDAEALGDGEYARLVDVLKEHEYKQSEGLRKLQLVRTIKPPEGGEPIDIIVDFLMPGESTCLLCFAHRRLVCFCHCHPGADSSRQCSTGTSRR